MQRTEKNRYVFGHWLNSRTFGTPLQQMQIRRESILQRDDVSELRIMYDDFQNFRNQDFKHLLSSMVDKNATKCIQYLVDRGFLDIKSLGHMLMQSAVELNKINIVEMLLANGMKINGRYTERTPLLIAISFKRKDISEFLIKRGADVNATDNMNWTPLHLSIVNKCFEITKLLLENNAIVNAFTHDGKTPLHYAIEYSDVDSIELLLRSNASANAFAHDGKTPLHFAVEYSADNTIEVLLNNGFSIDVKDRNKETPLHQAIKADKYFETSYLLEKGASINLPGAAGDTALHYAAILKRPDILKLLLENEADPNITNSNGETPLHKTGKLNHLEFENREIEYIEERCDRETVEYQVTHYEKNSIYNAKVLLEYGADPEIEDKSGKKAYNYSSTQQYYGLLQKKRKKRKKKSCNLL